MRRSRRRLVVTLYAAVALATTATVLGLWAGDVGDTTNTAARLESMTKGSEHTIFLADSVKQMLTSQRDDFVRVDPMRVHGKGEPVVVWSVA